MRAKCTQVTLILDHNSGGMYFPGISFFEGRFKSGEENVS